MLFTKEARGMCCRNDKGVLPRLPPLPPAMEDLFYSSAPSA
ncbi:unnamed protein product, partial [Scytosiphon promiscuus]